MNVKALKVASKSKASIFILHGFYAVSVALLAFYFMASGFVDNISELNFKGDDKGNVLFYGIVLLVMFVMSVLLGLLIYAPSFPVKDTGMLQMFTEQNKSARWYIRRVLKKRGILVFADHMIAHKLWEHKDIKQQKRENEKRKKENSIESLKESVGLKV